MVKREVSTQKPERGGFALSLRADIIKSLELLGGLGRDPFLCGLFGPFPGLRLGPGLGDACGRGPRRSGGRGGLRLLPGGLRRGIGPRTKLLAFGQAA